MADELALPIPPPAGDGLILPGEPQPIPVEGTIGLPTDVVPGLGVPAEIGGQAMGLPAPLPTDLFEEETPEECCDQIVQALESQSALINHTLEALMATIGALSGQQNGLLEQVIDRLIRVVDATLRPQQTLIRETITSTYSQISSLLSEQQVLLNQFFAQTAAAGTPVPGMGGPTTITGETVNVYQEGVNVHELAQTIANTVQAALYPLQTAQQQCCTPGVDPATSAALAQVATYLGGISGSLAQLVVSIPSLQIPAEQLYPPGGFVAGAGIGPQISISGAPPVEAVPPALPPMAGGAGIGAAVPLPSAPLPPPPPPPAPAVPVIDWTNPTEDFTDYELPRVMRELLAALADLRI